MSKYKASPLSYILVVFRESTFSTRSCAAGALNTRFPHRREEDLGEAIRVNVKVLRNLFTVLL